MLRLPSPTFTRRGLAASLAAVLLAGCAATAPTRGTLPDAAVLRARGLVLLFGGYTLASEALSATGTWKLAGEVSARGVPMLVSPPDSWPGVVQRLLARPEMRDVPVALFGYSWGAKAAIHAADALLRGGVPVQTLVLLEPHGPPPVPCGVPRTLVLLSGGLGFGMAQADPAAPARPGCAPVENRRIHAAVPWTYPVNHWSASYLPEVHAAALDAMLEDNRVRRRGPPGSA